MLRQLYKFRSNIVENLVFQCEFSTVCGKMHILCGHDSCMCSLRKAVCVVVFFREEMGVINVVFGADIGHARKGFCRTHGIVFTHLDDNITTCGYLHHSRSKFCCITFQNTIFHSSVEFSKLWVRNRGYMYFRSCLLLVYPM